MCTGHDDRIFQLKKGDHEFLCTFYYLICFCLKLPLFNILMCQFFCNILTIVENTTISQKTGCQSPSAMLPHPTRIKTSKVQYCKILQIHTISCTLKDPTICMAKANKHKFLCNTLISTNSSISVHKYYLCTAVTTGNTVQSIPIFKVQYCPKSTAKLWYTHTYAGHTMLQTGRSGVQFLSSEFFIDVILLATLWPWGRLSL
jgi:hypothetical protein